MKPDMSSEAIEARLALLSRLYVPLTLEDAVADENHPAPVDMSPEAVSARLDELSALFKLTLWLQQAQPSSKASS